MNLNDRISASSLAFSTASCALLIACLASNSPAQYPWPVTPFDQTHEITGTFCEFRDTGSYDHFHNGTDIPKDDGSPVYAVASGTVTSMSSVGSNAYVRVGQYAYVHIQPNPNLDLGSSVTAGQTVLGTILPGMGHVHFNDGLYNSEINGLREGGGLTPYSDPWAPIIRWVRFYVDGTGTQFPGNRLSGRVDVLAKVDEQNGPSSSRVSRRNNGAYLLSYKVLNEDRSSVVHEPSPNGLRFRFDSKPSNGYVHNVFSDALSSTTSHVYIVSNNLRSNNSWDTSDVPEGRYTVMVCAVDTRGNADTLYSQVEVTGDDVLAPEPPRLTHVQAATEGFEIGWAPNAEPDLAHYRLAFSADNLWWSYLNDPAEFEAGVTFHLFPVRFTTPRYFRLTAFDDAPIPNEGAASDVYGIRNSGAGGKVLIVDGFDRYGGAGSWPSGTHALSFTYGDAIGALGYDFDTCANEAVTSGRVRLGDYAAAFWFLGDESSADTTFSPAEQAQVKTYLEEGGNLFVNGSEIAWDLDQDNSSSRTTPADEAFLHTYLKADYAGDDAGSYTVNGAPGSIFDGLSFTYGTSPYPDDWPDYITPFGGSTACLKYATGTTAGIQYAGLFGSGQDPGRLVYLGFAFETIDGGQVRRELVKRVMNFFEVPTGIEMAAHAGNAPLRFELHQSYPNPVRLSAGGDPVRISYRLPQPARAILDIRNILGQRVRALTLGRQPAGQRSVLWDGRDDRGYLVGPGTYIYTIMAGEWRSSRRLLVLR